MLTRELLEMRRTRPLPNRFLLPLPKPIEVEELWRGGTLERDPNEGEGRAHAEKLWDRDGANKSRGSLTLAQRNVGEETLALLKELDALLRKRWVSNVRYRNRDSAGEGRRRARERTHLDRVVHRESLDENVSGLAETVNSVAGLLEKRNGELVRCPTCESQARTISTASDCEGSANQLS